MFWLETTVTAAAADNVWACVRYLLARYMGNHCSWLRKGRLIETGVQHGLAGKLWGPRGNFSLRLSEGSEDMLRFGQFRLNLEGLRRRKRRIGQSEVLVA
jgi:hypothetical protein